jgi:4-hydroxybenzoate polyprenyltransferase
VATALAVAAANVFNDRCDEPADVVNRPDRPLIAGRTTGNDADKFVLAASLGAVAASATLGAAASIAATALLVAGLGYSLLLRRVAFVGQAAVGALFAVPLLYGAAFSRGGVTGRTWIALGLAAMYVFAREVIKGIPDRPGDLAAGYRTPATVLGEAGALRLFRGAAVAFCAASVAAYLVADDPAYLAASLVCGVLPTLRTLAMVRGTPSADALSRAIAFSGLVFAAGVVPLLLLA